MKYAVIKTGGKQYKVAEGSVITVESLRQKKDAVVHFTDVLLYIPGDAKVTVGTPNVSNVTVFGKVLQEGKGDKIRVAKFHSKVRYRRNVGHRQHITKVKIEKIATTGDTVAKSVRTVKK